MPDNETDVSMDLVHDAIKMLNNIMLTVIIKRFIMKNNLLSQDNKFGSTEKVGW